MALETVPKDLRHLRACLLCSLVKVNLTAAYLASMLTVSIGVASVFCLYILLVLV